MSDKRIIGFFSSLSLPGGTTDEEDGYFEKLDEEFRSYIWGVTGIADKFDKLKSSDYGYDLRLVLFQFNVFPDKLKLSLLTEIEDFRPKEKAVGVNIYVDQENFFDRPETERRKFLGNAILDRLDLVASLVERSKFDTEVDKLRLDVQELLRKWFADTQLH